MVKKTCWFLLIVFTATLFLQTHCILVDFSIVIFWTSPFVVLGVSGLGGRFYSSFDGTSY